MQSNLSLDEQKSIFYISSNLKHFKSVSALLPFSQCIWICEICFASQLVLFGGGIAAAEYLGSIVIVFLSHWWAFPRFLLLAVRQECGTMVVSIP